jgi:hypothetical protein
MGFTTRRGLGRPNCVEGRDASPNDAHNLPMELITAMMAGIAAVIPRRSNEDDKPTGAEAVRTAIFEAEELQDRTYSAKLGEPEIVAGEGQFFDDPNVVIPVYDVPFDAQNRLVFDLPDGSTDDDSQFIDLLSVFSYGLDSMEDLAGENVPVEFFGGNVTVVWSEIEGDDGEEESDTTDEMGDSTVNIEKETISTDDTDA